MSNFQKILPQLITLSLFAVSSFFILHPFQWSSSFTIAFLLLLNLSIILSATYFGIKGVVTFSLASLFVVLLESLRQAELAVFPMILLAATGIIFYINCLRISHFVRLNNTELDNIEEEKNILSVELKHLRAESESLNQKLQSYATLKGLTERLNFTFSLGEMNSLITTETFRIIDKSSACLLYLVDQERQELNLISARTQGSETLPFGHKGLVNVKKGDIFDNWVFKQRGRLMITDTIKDFRFNVQDIESANKRGVRSLISVPLIRKNKLLGILRLDNISKEVYDADDLRLLDIIADLSAITVENMMLYQETEKLAITDGLTGLFVHRYFQERFDEEIARAIWTNSEPAFLMLDIDNFKRYNDRFGHIAGDIVLKQIAKLIVLSVNPGDIVARYGGEEFAVLLVNTSRGEALKVAERIRERVENEKFILRRELSEVRISGGLAFFSKDDETKESLIQRADQALYQAKLKGKNRICTF